MFVAWHSFRALRSQAKPDFVLGTAGPLLASSSTALGSFKAVKPCVSNFVSSADLLTFLICAKPEIVRDMNSSCMIDIEQCIVVTAELLHILAASN